MGFFDEPERRTAALQGLACIVGTVGIAGFASWVVSAPASGAQEVTAPAAVHIFGGIPASTTPPPPIAPECESGHDRLRQIGERLRSGNVVGAQHDVEVIFAVLAAQCGWTTDLVLLDLAGTGKRSLSPP